MRVYWVLSHVTQASHGCTSTIWGTCSSGLLTLLRLIIAGHGSAQVLHCC